MELHTQILQESILWLNGSGIHSECHSLKECREKLKGIYGEQEVNKALNITVKKNERPIN